MSASIVSRVSVNLQLRPSMIQLLLLRSSQTPPIRPVVLQMLIRLLVVPLAILHVSGLSLPLRQHDGLLRGVNVSHQIQKKAPVPWAQRRQDFCVALTRGHHVRRLHQCPEVVSLSQQSTSCQIPLQGKFVPCIPQSANLCDTAHPDTSCNQMFANRIPSSAQEHFSTRKFDSRSSNGLTRHSP